jgi:hypothetical protein
LGANAYVVKPIDFVQFVEVIRQVGLFWAVVNQPPPLASPINIDQQAGNSSQ